MSLEETGGGTAMLEERRERGEEVVRGKYRHLTVSHKEKGRTLVRMTPATTPSQVLEVACSHWHLPQDKYSLMFCNCPLTGNLPISQWNVPVTATLEVVPKGPPAQSSDDLVVVNIRDNHEVFTHAFVKNETLWNIMQAVYPRFNLIANKRLRVTYMGTPLSLEELKETKVLNLNLKKEILFRILEEDDKVEKNAGDYIPERTPQAPSQSSMVQQKMSQNPSKIHLESNKINKKKKPLSTKKKSDERPLSRSKLLDHMGLVYKTNLKSKLTHVSPDKEFLDGEFVTSDSDDGSHSECLIYMETIIRVVFPSGYVLQGLFSPMARIKDVCEFLKKYLIKETNFKLYKTQKMDQPLDPDKNLFNLQLVPTGRLFFGTDDTLMEPWREKFYLKEELIKTAVSRRVASITGDSLRNKEHNSSITIEMSSDLEGQIKSSSETIKSVNSKITSDSKH